jgi:hypothetical protein
VKRHTRRLVLLIAIALLALCLFGFSLTAPGACALGWRDFGPREMLLTCFTGDAYLHGELMGEDGRALPDKMATLVIQRAYGIDSAALQSDAVDQPVFIRSATSDADGRFTMRVPAQYLADRGRPCLYIYKLEVNVELLKTKLFNGLPLAAHESLVCQFEVSPPYWTPG